MAFAFRPHHRQDGRTVQPQRASVQPALSAIGEGAWRAPRQVGGLRGQVGGPGTVEYVIHERRRALPFVNNVGSVGD